MALTSLDGVSVSRELRIQLATDERCLSHMRPWLRRSGPLVVLDCFWAYLAASVGVPGWAAVWLVARAAHRVHLVWLGQSRVKDARDTLKRAILGIWLGGLLNALLMPAFFLNGANTATKLTATVLSLWLIGPMVATASGIVRAFVGGSAPTLALAVCWASYGGWSGVGWCITLALSIIVAFAAVQQERHSWEHVELLLAENEALTSSLEEARDRAEKASASKTRFFAAASHDLRQPLHALSINATTLDLVARRSDNPLLVELSQGIGSALRQSRGLLDGLLDISRLDAHAVRTHIVPTELSAVLVTLRDEYSALAEEKGLSFVLKSDDSRSDVWASTDTDQLMRIMGNLVDNAIKFTQKGAISLSTFLDGPNAAVIKLTDSGPGIAEQDRERVFEEFYQAGNAGRDRSQGLGLGLAIVRRTAALLGITISLDCPVGGGTTFELRLPASAPGSTVSRSSAGVSLDRLSILVVDDEVEVRKSMCLYLRQIGWIAEAVASVEEMNALLRGGFLADAVVVDFRLRDETALDAIRELRQRDERLPIVVVTGDTAPERLTEFSGLASQVLHKPVEGDRLVSALTEAVNEAG